jgi:mercuric transport protein
MKVIVFLCLSVLCGISFAAEKSVLLSIPGMDCPVCPITIKKSLLKVNGVKSANVSYESKTAAVSFDDQLTDINILLQATENVGYPSILKEGKP